MMTSFGGQKLLEQENDPGSGGPASDGFGLSADTVLLKCHIHSHLGWEANVTDSLSCPIILEKPCERVKLQAGAFANKPGHIF